MKISLSSLPVFTYYKQFNYIIMQSRSERIRHITKNNNYKKEHMLSTSYIKYK